MDENQPLPEGPITSELINEDPTFADIVLTFVEGLDTRLQKMENALHTQDFEALRVAAHQLKGSGGGYGFPILTERASQIETLARTHELSECNNAVADLKDIITRISVSPPA